MSNELVKQSQGLTFTRDQEDLIKKQIAPKASSEELALFLYVAKKTGLDPLSKQIYCLSRKVKDGNNYIDKMTIQTGIDGYRVIAQRSNLYAGQSEPIYIYDKPSDAYPNCAKVTVFKFHPTTGARYEAAVGVAFWDEYVPLVDEYKDGKKTGNRVPNAMWDKMPHNQLAKVAEALALRKAFPQDLSGLYTTTEMEQADSDQEVSTPITNEIADELRAKFIALLPEYGEYFGEGAAANYHPDNWKKEQTAQNFVLAIDWMQREIETAKHKQK